MNPKKKCKRIYLREEDIDTQILSLLDDVSISSNIVQWYLDKKEKIQDPNLEKYVLRERKLRELITKKEQKKDRLIMSLSDEDDEMIRESFRKNIRILQDEIIQMNQEKENLSTL
ncbi:MAG: hypothetical protein U9Q15_03775 [Patescibacteria group bacterium]|nr:hypothetical protein [Patescibacteria group bacterium]